MNLLIDFITIHIKGGASEYARYFIMELVRMKREGKIPGINLYALFDSTKPIAYKDLMEDALSSNCSIEYIDIAKTSITDIVDSYNIDRFFITCAQFIGSYQDIEKLRCEIVCVIHDLCDQELYFNHINEYVDLIRDHTQVILADKSFKTKLHNLRIALGVAKRFVMNRKNYKYEKDLDKLKPIIQLLQSNPNSKTIVVSEYTKSSLMYNYDINDDSLLVLYSPERIYCDVNDTIENKDLQSIIETKKKFYLLVSANRVFKNPNKVVRAFRQFVKNNPDAYLVTVGYPDVLGKNIINLDFLSDNDLANAYKHCYALVYPSFFEGFGYPPIEAMHYGKPILSTNATSVPEILEDAPIYFSPLYESGIFHAFQKLTEDRYSTYCELSRKQYEKTQKRQLNDALKLLQLLTLE